MPKLGEGLEKLKSFTPQEPTSLPDLPSLPNPEDPEFQSGEVGTGIKIARAISVLLAGASDPNLAAALGQQFQRQDLLAREDAQRRYNLALGRQQAEREEVAFQEEARKVRVGEQQDTANIQLRAYEAAITAARVELEMTQDPDKQTNLPVTIAKLTDLRDAMVGEQAKPAQFKSPLELIGQVPQGEISKAMIEGTGAELVASVNERLLKQIPKPLISEQNFQTILSGADPVTEAYGRIIFSVVPDPRTETFASQADSLAFGSALRGLAAHNPEKHDEIMETVTQAWYESGSVSDMRTAEELFADTEHNNSDHKKDSRWHPAGTYPKPKPAFVGPPAPGKFDRFLSGAKELGGKFIVTEEEKKAKRAKKEGK